MQQIGRPPERKRIPVVLTVQEVLTLLSLPAARPAGWMRWYLRTDGQVFGTWGMDCNRSISALHISQWVPMQSSQPEGRGQSTFRPASVHSFSTRPHSLRPTDLPEGAPA